MPRTQSTPAADPRLEYLSANLVSGATPVPQGVIDDLRFFRAELDKRGQKMKFCALQSWMKEQHGFIAQRTRFRSIAEANGIVPWWS